MIPQRKGAGVPSNVEAASLRVENERLKILMRGLVPAAAAYGRRVDRIGQYPELMPYLTPELLAENIAENVEPGGEAGE